ncbi:MAG: ABC transporter permease [Oscillospiraceae bacterium]|nr:ABC transporter permease [Oscillospiraceae bacterium]
MVLSFLSREETWGVVNEFTTRNYIKIFEPIYLHTFWESIKLAFLVTALVILTGYPFGYYMAKLSPKKRGLMLMLVTIPFWTSSLMRLYGWIVIFRANGILDTVLMGLHITGEPLKLLYTYPAVVVGMIYALLPFMILSFYSSVEKMDWTLVEAARDLGAGPVRAFFTVTLKCTMPGLMTGVILTFVPSMALFFIADILGGNKIALIGNVIQDQLMKVHDWPFAAALSVILMLMTTLMIFLYRKITGSRDVEGII